MEEKISNREIQKEIRYILNQTTYTEDDAIIKLHEFGGDYKKVIKDFMCIPDKKKDTNVKSINQEIYKQIRYKLDASMKEYRDNNPIDINHVVENFKESDEKLKQKQNK